jgi:hypothetical protein
LTVGGIAGPILIPSLSSKGFPIDDDGRSEVAPVLELAHSDMTESVLISAYDLHHRLLGEKDWSQDIAKYSNSPLGTPSLVVLDSGGYELSDDFESGEPSRGPRFPKEFSFDEYVNLVDSFPKEANLLVVSYDRPSKSRPTYAAQRGSAQDFFAQRPHLRSDFLLKPEGEDRYIEPTKTVPDIKNWKIFDVVGVTEKDLGGTVFDRLLCLSRLRAAMDAGGCGAIPVHVFGGLDPLYTPLYFMCGAEIFDGLSWLKYAYHSDVAMHPDAARILNFQVDQRPERADQLRHFANLAYLAKMKRRLQIWASDTKRFEELGPHHVVLREIFDSVEAER